MHHRKCECDEEAMDITKDIRPLTEFKRDTARFISHLKETGRPSILTVKIGVTRLLC